MASFGSLGDGWSIGGAWQSPFSRLYPLLNATEFRNLRLFSEGQSQLARFSYPVKVLLTTDWLPQAVVDPAGQLIWIEWEQRPNWKKKVDVRFNRFTDCYAVVIDMLLPDDDYRLEIGSNPKLKGKRKDATAAVQVRH